MVAERLDVRLDHERRKKLRELTQRHKTSASELIRQLIDEKYEADSLERRLEAVRRIASLNIEEVPNPETLSKQLAEKYGPLP